MPKTIKLSEDYTLHVDVQPVRGRQFHLSVKSQWSNARDPEALENRFSVTLPRNQMLALASAILEGVKS